MQFSDLVVFEFVGGDEFGDLLVEEGDVSLVLSTHTFLLVRQLGEVVLQMVDFGTAGFACVEMLMLQLFQSFVFLLDYSLQLLPAPFELLSLEVYLAVLLLH